MAARFLGLDLAWVDTNRSGLAALDERGELIALCAERRSDAEVLAWIREQLASATCGAIAIDMPTIVREAHGTRCCERDLRADFGDAHAGPYPANLGLGPFANPAGGRAAVLLAELRADGVVHTCDVAAGDRRIVAFETFPHAAAVALFGLFRIPRYKKKRGRDWPGVLAEWTRYRGLLDTLAQRDPPLRVRPACLPATAPRERYKRFDEALDAVVCAYVASFVHRHGTASDRVRVYGDMAGGHIVVPKRSHVKRAPGGYTDPVTTTNNQPFLTDVQELRRRAREQIEKGAITPAYGLDPKQSIEVLQNALATEIVCVLRYTMHSVAATGISSEGPKDEFAQHAKEEREHMEWIAERINQLGGTPNFNPEGLAMRSASQYGPEDLNLVGMIKENLIAERIAIEHYRELVHFFGEKDPTSRILMERILAVEEEHANDMHDLLVAHEGKPPLEK